MRKFTLSFLAIGLLSLIAVGQSVKKNTAVDSEKQEILKVFNEYLKAMQADQPERDRVRERLLTEDYFYMGVDGLPAGKKFLMQRQKRNGLRINSMKMTDIEIRLYENTAILTMRYAGSGVDKGQAWGGDGEQAGFTTVMVKQKGVWLIAADTFGREIEN